MSKLRIRNRMTGQVKLKQRLQLEEIKFPEEAQNTRYVDDSIIIM
jgi:hypothetical protein